jgi:hypothetical protein
VPCYTHLNANQNSHATINNNRYANADQHADQHTDGDTHEYAYSHADPSSYVL